MNIYELSSVMSLKLGFLISLKQDLSDKSFFKEDIYTLGCLSDKEWAGDLSSNTEYCYCDKDR